MIKLKGSGVCSGIVIGRIAYIDRSAPDVRMVRADDPAVEMKRVEEAKAVARAQLSELYEKTLEDVGEESAQIFNIQRMMLDDQDYNNAVKNIITADKLNAEYAVAVTADNFEMMLSSMQDDYMRARSADVRDLSDRLIRCLNGKAQAENSFSGERIICAFDLTPSETVQMDKSNVLAMVTAVGSSVSHAAILAKTMGIPAVVGVGRKLSSEYNGELAAVDGTDGVIYIDPDENTLAELEAKHKEELKHREIVKKLKGRSTATRDGRKINLYANIGGVSDVEAVIANDAEGIGLFRSEFLYMEGKTLPSEEVQFAAYKKVIEAMDGKRVIVRTMDIGADKKTDCLDLEPEENPAMGYRAIRICLNNGDIFKTQLRALYRASAYGKLAIMFPMIISAGEIRTAKYFVDEVRSELRAEGIPFDENVEIGIMIETPAAAVISDILANEVDFFSIGTNDLTQYTLAIDRQNPVLEEFYDPYHPALKRMIKTVIDNAHAAGIWVGICGELGSDPHMTDWLIKAGIDEISVSPSMVLEIRGRISETEASI
ncbi:MAG: phosphoenolpyruvate--protein phosphotransferase [Oscillospiraceae bacterium]|nr:phosphoenolpyruvate--protein phosphotransferase [Oscillospiraceae bacterium]